LFRRCFMEMTEEPSLEPVKHPETELRAVHHRTLSQPL
jgi:hypothetical protein